ncbi:hypothetical protein [Streptomyces sp. NPDC088254]|uniref:hypothetical protein n=1 Tax=Streptomyces sp. NPDC088254 TaxID=3365847 RepID=UPI0038067819
MSNEQPPPDDEQGDEPTVAEYHRADASKFPTVPAGQMAAVEAMAAAAGFLPDDDSKLAEHNRKMLRRQFGTADTSTPAGKFQAQMLDAIEQYERERAAERAAQGDTNPYDLAPWEDAHGLTNEYEAARASKDPGALDLFLDNLAEDFHLDDVRALRTAAAAVQAAMGRIALAARVKGMSPDQIAAETGYTASRIAQFIREEKQRLATP